MAGDIVPNAFAKRVKGMFLLSLGVSFIAVIIVAIGSPIAGLVVFLVVIAAESFVYMVFLRPLIAQNRVLKTGEAAQAEILEISDTGTTVNTNPQVKLLLMVHPKSGEPYQARTRAVVSRLQIHLFQPGALIPVSIDPDDRNMVAVGSLDERSITSASREEQVRQSQEMVRNFEKANDAILGSGKPAEAVVLKGWELGINVNGKNPAMQLLLEVRPAERPAFRAGATCVVDQGDVGKFMPGGTIHVKYDPEDTTRVAVEQS